MISLHYSGTHYALTKAIKKTNEILSGDAFYERISALPQMSDTNLSPPEISSILKKSNRKIHVAIYWNPFGRTAKTIASNKIKINVSKLSRVTAFAVHTLIHETILTIDLLGKKNNLETEPKNSEEFESLPWKIGEVAEIISRKARKFA